MSELAFLKELLQPAIREGARELAPATEMDALLRSLETSNRARTQDYIPADLQAEALKRFWPGMQIGGYRDAYLLSSALCIRHPGANLCILEDGPRFARMVEAVDAWRQKQAAYRRCYWGFVRSFFTYDTYAEDAPPAGVKNAELLRHYLADNLTHLHSAHAPEWVSVAHANKALFEKRPFDAYARIALSDEGGALDAMYDALGIHKSSWFQRELILAQVRHACEAADAQFDARLVRLLELVIANEVIRDRGLTLLLNRYARRDSPPLHQKLRDGAVGAWGNPWLPSNQKRWGGVDDGARAMVTDWLKLEFIETFFTKLADDGVGDTRRLNFWKRYVKSIEHIQFALGARALYSREPDFVSLRKKMKGLTSEIRGTGSDNNAFIMRMGKVVIVEFGAAGNAMYAYDAAKALPFKWEKPLFLAVDAENSLKQTRNSAKWTHKDNVRGWEQWEARFRSDLANEYSVHADEAKAKRDGSTPKSRPATPPPTLVVAPASPPPTYERIRHETSRASSSALAVAEPSVDDQWAAAGAAMKDYSFSNLRTFASGQGLVLDNKTQEGGNLWVRTSDDTDHVNWVLTRWGFRYKDGKGWWRSTLD